ncbi:transposase [Streptomyces violaceus]|uniref:Transposase n=1 Tax=Streptomyces violaceus TaxID=1936 RepID=A0ABZ1P2P2_STRVL
MDSRWIFRIHAASQVLGPSGLHPGGPRARPGLGPGVDGRHDLLQAWRAVPALFYYVHEYTGRKNQPQGFGWRDFRDLLIRARTQLGGPIVLIWDNVRLHLTKSLRAFIEANSDWLTVFQLPTYAPDLNPQEGIWSLAGQSRSPAAVARTPTRQVRAAQLTTVTGVFGLFVPRVSPQKKLPTAPPIRPPHIPFRPGCRPTPSGRRSAGSGRFRG